MHQSLERPMWYQNLAMLILFLIFTKSVPDKMVPAPTSDYLAGRTHIGGESHSRTHTHTHRLFNICIIYVYILCGVCYPDCFLFTVSGSMLSFTATPQLLTFLPFRVLRGVPSAAMRLGSSCCCWVEIRLFS